MDNKKANILLKAILAILTATIAGVIVYIITTGDIPKLLIITNNPSQPTTEVSASPSTDDTQAGNTSDIGTLPSENANTGANSTIKVDPSPEPSLSKNYDWISIYQIKYISLDSEAKTVTLAITVQYYLDSQEKGQLSVLGNYSDINLWSSLGPEGDFVIENGNGSKEFVVSVPVPEWNEFSIRAYIHPFPQQTEEWIPIIKTDPIPFDIKEIFSNITSN